MSAQADDVKFVVVYRRAGDLSSFSDYVPFEYGKTLATEAEGDAEYQVLLFDEHLNLVGISDVRTLHASNSVMIAEGDLHVIG